MIREIVLICVPHKMIPHWQETRDALLEIADYALTFHSDAVDIRFFNHHYQRQGVRV